MGNELYFIKVGKTKYVNDLTKQGILHLSLAEEFRNRKKYGGKKYDSEEGSLPLSYKFLVDMGDNNFQNPDTILDLSNAKVKGNECIYCFKAISQQQIKNGCALLPYDFFSNLIETNDWGKYSLLLIKNTAEFLDCVERATQKYNYSYLFKPVLYDDHFFDIPYPLFSREYAIETYFHKREKFKEQSEYRILLQNNQHEALRLQIGTDFFTIDNYKQKDNLEDLDTGRPVLLKLQ